MGSRVALCITLALLLANGSAVARTDDEIDGDVVPYAHRGQVKLGIGAPLPDDSGSCGASNGGTTAFSAAGTFTGGDVR